MASAQGTLLAALGGAAATLGAAHAYVRLEAAEKRGRAVEAELKAVQKDLAREREKVHARESTLAELEQRLKEAHVENRDLEARLDQEHTARARERVQCVTHPVPAAPRRAGHHGQVQNALERKWQMTSSNETTIEV